MAEQHLFTYPSTTYTNTGKEFLSGVQWLWTDGHSSIYSRALSLINGGKGLGAFAIGSWSQTNSWTWPGPDGWDVTWTSDDGTATVQSKQTVEVYNKAEWRENGLHKVTGSNGDTYSSTFYYDSKHNLLNNESYKDLYVGGNYSGGHTIAFNGLSGTSNDEADDEIATEAVNWTSSVNYNEAGIRDEKINSLNSLNYENKKYKFSYDVANDYSQGDKNQVNPAHKKFDQSQMYLIKDGTQTFSSYHFLDKSSGFEFKFSELVSEFDFVNDTAVMKFKDIFLTDKGVTYETDQLELEMSSKEIDQINLGEEIGDPLGGIDSHIKKIVLPVINKFSNEAIKEDNLITADDEAKTTLINAGAGDDTVAGGAGADKVAGGDGIDAITGGSGADTIDGGTGDDSLNAGEGDDSVVAGAGADEIDGGDGADKLAGGEGADDLMGGAGNDVLDGGTGNDVLYSGDGNDNVSGGDGADLIVGGDGAGNDNYDGGKGIDTVKYTSAKAGIRVDLVKGTAGSITVGDAAGIGADKLKGIENIISGNFSDLIIGSKDANSITGGDGDDSIDGGLGSDTMVGGQGADVFVLSTKPAANNLDTISDFESGVDKIQLSVKTFAKLKAATDYLVTGVPTAANHYLIYDSASGKLSYDADGNAPKSKPVDIALIGKGLTITTADFIII